MRVLLISTVLLCLAACASPRSQQASTTAPVAAVAIPPPPPPGPPAAAPQPLVAVSVAPAPAPAPPPPAAIPPALPAASSPPPVAASAAPPPPTVVVWPGPILDPALIFAGFVNPPGPNRLTLSNFNFAQAHVEAVVATQPDCVMDGAVSDFILPLNGTRIIEAPPGADVCWRHELPPAPDAKPGPPLWSGWRRAYLGRGLPIDSTI